MLTAAQFDSLSVPLTDLYAEFEQSVLEDIARRILKMGSSTETAAWQLQRITESGAVYEEVISKLSKLTGKSEAVLKETFEQAGVKSLRFDDNIYRQAGLNPLSLNLSPQMLRVLQIGLAKTNRAILNLTGTTAIASQDLFLSTSNLVYQQVITGTMGYDQALRNAIKKLGDSALPIRYPSGHTDKLDVALRRNLLTGISQTTAQLQLARANELDSDLVEMSAHIGARPSHQEWQGKVFSISGTSKKYPPFVESTGYGSVTGYAGANCRHSSFPFFEGLSERNYTEKELEKLDKKVTYNDKELSSYEASQVQRGIERKIREWKRKAGTLEAAKLDNTFEISKVKEWQAKARNFTDQTGLRRQYVREGIGSVPTKNTIVDTFNPEKYYSLEKTNLNFDDYKNKAYREINSEEKIALENYSGDTYIDINKIARGEIEPPPIGQRITKDISIDVPADNPMAFLFGEGEGFTIKKKYLDFDPNLDIKNLDSILNKSKIPDNFILHRGFGSEEIYNLIKDGNLINGSIYQDRGYASTSLLKKTAERFSNKKFPVILEIYADKNSSGLLIDTERLFNRVAQTNEYEFLLPRNAKMEIISSEIFIDEDSRRVAKIVLRYK